MLQTAEGSLAPVSQQYGHGISVGGSRGFTRMFTEHGHLMCIMSVMPRTAYYQGVHRMWTRDKRTEYYFPQFAHLGEQAVLNKEIFYDSVSTGGDDTWGYQSRFAEMKSMPDRVCGDFKDSLKYWQAGREFTVRPALNGSFVEADPTHRYFTNTVA